LLRLEESTADGAVVAGAEDMRWINDDRNAGSYFASTPEACYRDCLGLTTIVDVGGSFSWSQELNESLNCGTDS